MPQLGFFVYLCGLYGNGAVKNPACNLYTIRDVIEKDFDNRCNGKYFNPNKRIAA